MSLHPIASQFLSVSLQSPTLPLLLRTPTPEDVPALHSLLSNPLNTEHDTRGAPAGGPTVADTELQVQKLRDAAAQEKPGRLNLAVVDTTTGKVEGLGGFGHIVSLEDGTRSGSVGVMLNPDVRGKGFGSEAIRLSVEWGFESAGLEEQRVETLDRNAGMRKIIEKVLVPRGWEGGKKILETGDWEWEFKVSKEVWEGTAKKRPL